MHTVHMLTEKSTLHLRCYVVRECLQLEPMLNQWTKCSEFLGSVFLPNTRTQDWLTHLALVV